MNPTGCSPCCDETNTVNVPGSQGGNAYTTTTANFIIPNIGVSVPISVGSTAWMAIGQKIFISDGTFAGSFEVLSINSSILFQGTFLGYTDDSSPGDTISSGAAVVPSGIQQPFNTTTLKALNATLLTGISALTDNTGATASNTIAAGVGISTVTIPIQFAAMTTAAADLVTNYTPGYAFKILSASIAVTTLGAGAGATQNINLEIGTTNLTGGVVNITLANTATLGALIAGTAITAANTGTAVDTISVEVAAGGTIFTSGAGVLLLRLQNMDTADAAASLSDKLNDILAALQT